MKVAVVTRLLAKRDVYIDSGHFFSVQSQSQFAVLRLKTETENYFLTRDSLFFTKASQPE
ncbi:hypothetical protein GCM10028861_10980 [Flavobacterium koreense]